MKELGDLFHFSETFRYFKEGGKCKYFQDGIGQRARANQFLNPKVTDFYFLIPVSPLNKMLR